MAETRKLVAIAGLALVLLADQASASEYELAIKPNLVYAEHDGIKLFGDLYLSRGRPKVPVLVAVHGGGWQAGTRAFYQHWGLFLAGKGYGLFSIDYRLGKSGGYPAAIYDTKAAIQFIRAKAAEFDIDPDRIGLLGDSAGGYLAAMLALAGDRFTAAYRDDPYNDVPFTAKAAVGFYGIYDMLAQWRHDVSRQRNQERLAQINHDFIVRPRANITEQFLGVSPMQDLPRYREASPIIYATGDRRIDRTALQFLVINGDRDVLVDPKTQSDAFLTALRRAGFSATQIVIPGAGHFWVSDPFENLPDSYGAMAVPPLLKFLREAL